MTITEDTVDKNSSGQEDQSIEGMEQDYFTALKSIENGMKTNDDDDGKVGDEVSETKTANTEKINSIFYKSFQS